MTGKVKNRKYHYVYKTINKINGMEYIGVHSTDDMDDGYIGSGTYLRSSIKKYGRENFDKHILIYCQSRCEALNKERDLVSPEYIVNPKSYNLVLGGGLPLLRDETFRKFVGIKTTKPEPVKIQYRADIPEDQRIAFKPNDKAIKRQRALLFLTMNDDNELLYRVNDMLLSHADGLCSTLTTLYNDKRFHAKTHKTLRRLLDNGWMPAFIKPQTFTAD